MLSTKVTKWRTLQSQCFCSKQQSFYAILESFQVWNVSSLKLGLFKVGFTCCFLLIWFQNCEYQLRTTQFWNPFIKVETEFKVQSQFSWCFCKSGYLLQTKCIKDFKIAQQEFCLYQIYDVENLHHNLMGK